MKKLFFIVFVLSLAIISFAQITYIPTEAQLHQFLKTKTYVVKDPQIMSEFNIGIDTSIHCCWHITPYQIISYNQFKHLKDSKNNSYLMTVTVFPNKHPDQAYDFLMLLLGGHGKNVPYMPVIAGVPLDFHANENFSYYYKLPAFVKFIQKHVKILLNNPKLLSKNKLYNYYKHNLHNLKNKTIVFTPDQLAYSVNTVDKIHRYYAGKVAIVSQDSLVKLIQSGDTSIVFAHIAAPSPDQMKPYSKCYKFLLDVNGNLYYYGWHRMNPADKNTFLIRDFIKINKKTF